MKLGSAEGFVSPSAESYSLGYSVPVVSSFSTWLLIVNQVLIKLQKSHINYFTIWLKFRFVYVYNILDSFLLQFILIHRWKT